LQKTIPSARFLAEGSIIVVSILLAFGVDAWWESRQQARRVEEALTNLEAAFVMNRTLLEEEVERLRTWREGLAVFHEKSGTPVGTEAAQFALTAIHRPIVTNLNSEEVLALLEDAALLQLSDPALQAATARWRAMWKTILASHESIYRLQNAALVALARRPATRVEVLSGDGEWADPNHALREARADDEIVALATAKLQYWNALNSLYAAQMTRVDAVIEQIRRHRDQRHIVD